MSLAQAVPEDHMVLQHFKGWYKGECVTVTAVLERTCVVKRLRSQDKILVNKHLLFVEEGFTLAVVNEDKVAAKARVQRGWKTNWRRNPPTRTV